MRRSALIVPVTVLLGLLLTVAPAAAESSARVTEPSHNQDITRDSLVPVEVWVDKLASDSVTSVRVQLFGDRNSYSRTSLKCVEPCGSTSQRWVGAFDPRPSPPIRNGAWNLQLSINQATFENRITLYLSLPPSPVTDLQTVPQEKSVQLSWSRAPEPDISGYRVERSTSDGGWKQVASLGAGATSYTDNVSPGSYRYRVISVRPNGTGGGEVTAASAQKSTVVEPPQVPSEKPKSEATGNGTGGNGTAPGSNVANGSGTVPNARRGPLTAHVPPPPPARRGFGLNLRSLAQAFGNQGPGEGAEGDAYGEGEGFSEQLDYSGVDPVTGEPIDLPLGSGIQQLLISQLTNRPLLVSLGVGLLLLVLALYILRWARRTPAPLDAEQDNSSWETATASPSALGRVFRGRGRSETTAGRVPSPTTAPLTPRGSGPASPQGGAMKERPAATPSPGRPPVRTPTASPLFEGNGQERRPSRDEELSSRDGGLSSRDEGRRGSRDGAQVSREEARQASRDEGRRGSRDEAPVTREARQVRGEPRVPPEQGRRVSREQARQGGSVLFAERQSSAAPTSRPDPSGPGYGTGSVKVLRPPSSEP